jgi:phosphopantothenoylcysteine decarboxylase/phosphopantothenate--cysteine ligase
MAEPERIFATISEFFKKSGPAAKKKLNGKRFLITAGPTREALDPVRFISNHSSGKMGYAIAEAARDAGAHVTLVTGPTNLSEPAGIRVKHVTTTIEMGKVVSSEFAKSDCLIMAAAPADFAPRVASRLKIKKQPAKKDFAIQLEPTIDILASVSSKKRKGQIVVGFALETDNGLKNAKAKLSGKKLDMIVLNSPSPKTGFNADTNQVTIISPSGRAETWPLETKASIAQRLIDKISSIL